MGFLVSFVGFALQSGEVDFEAGANAVYYFDEVGSAICPWFGTVVSPWGRPVPLQPGLGALLALGRFYTPPVCLRSLQRGIRKISHTVTGIGLRGRAMTDDSIEPADEFMQ